MSYRYGRGAAAAMLSSALVVRMFIGLSVDYPAAMNAAWMCPLIGLVIYLPFALAMQHARRIGTASPWENIASSLPRPAARIMEVLFALLLAYDTAATVRLTASSSNIIALGDASVYLLILPLMLVVAAVILMGGDALGDSTRIALRILPLFALIVLLVQIRGYRVGWLAPLFGTGVGGILGGSCYCAGCLALMSLIWLIAVPDRNGRPLYRCILFPVLGVVILLLTQQMTYPVMPEAEFTRAARIELLLSNGRISLYPQFVLNMLWFGGLLILLSSEAVAAAAYLHRIVPGMKIWLIALLETAAVSAAAIWNPSWLKRNADATVLMFPLLGALIALPLIGILISKRGKTTCTNSE